MKSLREILSGRVRESLAQFLKAKEESRRAPVLISRRQYQNAMNARAQKRRAVLQYVERKQEKKRAEIRAVMKEMGKTPIEIQARLISLGLIHDVRVKVSARG